MIDKLSYFKFIMLCKLQMFLGKIGFKMCEGPNQPCFKKAERVRLNTQYNDDERNFATLCPDCENEVRAIYDEMWREYYASIL